MLQPLCRSCFSCGCLLSGSSELMSPTDLAGRLALPQLARALPQQISPRPESRRYEVRIEVLLHNAPNPKP